MTIRPSQRGFSLVELILVIVITGVLSGVIVVFVRPAIEGFLAQRGRNEMQFAVQAALQVMTRDVRAALPNSIRTPGGNCFELMPTSGGGRYRQQAAVGLDASTCTAATCSQPLDTSTSTSSFDVLGPLNGQAKVGDFVVVGNQNGNEAYALSNLSAITALSTPADLGFGSLRMTVNTVQFPVGYTGGRFFVVPNADQAVFFTCQGAGVDAKGNGTGTLLRRKAYGFNATYPTSCPAGGDVIATSVAACSFQYDRTSLTEYGVMSLRLELARNGERAALQVSTMVSNVP